MQVGLTLGIRGGMQNVGYPEKSVFGSALIPLIIVVFGTTYALAATSAEIEEWLQAHNRYRSRHGVSPLTWSDAIAARAQALADSCPDGHVGSEYGENLAWASPASYRPEVSVIVQWWYEEEFSYDYDAPGFRSATGHFTQVVWKGSLEIGCGFATNCPLPGKKNIWLCLYNPPGNYRGQYAKNVFPPLFSAVSAAGGSKPGTLSVKEQGQ